MPIKKSQYDKLDKAFDGTKAHTRFLDFETRKIIAVESSDGKVDVRYDSRGILEGREYKSLADFEKEAYKKK